MYVNNGLTMIYTSSIENISDSRITQRENKMFVEYNKSNIYSDFSDKNMRNYKDNMKIEDEIVITSTRCCQ